MHHGFVETLCMYTTSVWLWGRGWTWISEPKLPSVSLLPCNAFLCACTYVQPLRLMQAVVNGSNLDCAAAPGWVLSTSLTCSIQVGFLLKRTALCPNIAITRDMR